MFATTFFAVLDVSSGTLTYVNGGHDAPAVIGPRGIKQRLNPTGPAVGILPELELFDAEGCAGTGRHAVLLHQRCHRSTRPFGQRNVGEPRMLSLICEPVLSVAALVERVDAALVAGSYAGADPFDDITMLCVRRRTDAGGMSSSGRSVPCWSTRTVPGSTPRLRARIL